MLGHAKILAILVPYKNTHNPTVYCSIPTNTPSRTPSSSARDINYRVPYFLQCTPLFLASMICSSFSQLSHPITTAMRRWNPSPCKGFVKGSAIINFVCLCKSSASLFFTIASWRHAFLAVRCLFLSLRGGTDMIRVMVDILSWNTIGSFSFSPNPSMKLFAHSSFS